MKDHHYAVIFHPIPEGGFQVIVPALPEIITYGRTLDEAREMARDAILCHLRGLLKDGEEIPEDPLAQQQPVTEELGSANGDRTRTLRLERPAC